MTTRAPSSCSSSSSLASAEAFVHRLPMSDPGDVSALAALLDDGTLAAADIVAVIGKTEGNGGVNDFTRGYFTLSLFSLLARHLPATADQLMARIPCVLSGGTEGVMSPHYLVFARLGRPEAGTRSPRPALAIGTAFSEPLPAQHVGRLEQALSVARAVRAAMADAGLDDPRDVAFVQVKCPCVTVARAQAARADGHEVVTSDSNRSMALSRAAGAFGVALALGEWPAREPASPVPSSPTPALEQAFADDLLQRFDRHCDRASISSGVEVRCNEVIVLGNSRRWRGPLRIASRPMADALDLPAVTAVLGELDLRACPALTDADRPRIAGVLVKCEPDRRGRVRGHRHTMLDDTDINAQRHIRGAVAGLVAGVLGDGRIFVSGGAEHQGPDGGGLIAVIAQAGEARE